MKSLQSFGLGVLLTAAMAFGGVAVASSGGSSSPNAGPGGDTPAVVAPAAIAAAKQQMLYSPITPCRIVDTRKTTPMGPGAIRTFYVAGTTGFSPQGGKTGGCGIPLGATSVAVSVTAVGATARGFLDASPSTTPTAAATFLNYGIGNISAGATLGIGLGSAPHLRIRNSGGPTDLVIDVTGYYRPQIHATLSASGGILDGSPRVLSSTRLSTGSYRVQLDIDPAGCTPIASINGSAYFASSYVSSGYVYANTYAPGGTLTDLYWTLSVLC